MIQRDPNRRPRVMTKWSQQAVLENAKRFTTRMEFHRTSPSAYSFAQRNGFLDKACEHMIYRRRFPGTLLACRDEAAKYNTRTQFHLKSCTAYEYALKNGWLDIICSHMPARNSQPRNFWTKDLIAAEAKKYLTRSMFQRNAGAAVAAARRLGILDQVCNHMVLTKKTGRLLDDETVPIRSC